MAAVLRFASGGLSISTMGWVGGGLVGISYALLVREGFELNTVLRLLAGTLLAAAAFTLANGLQQQNHPQLARLVPGHLALLRRTLQSGHFLLLCLGALCAVALMGDSARGVQLAVLLMPHLLWVACTGAMRRWLWLPVPGLALVGLVYGLGAWGIEKDAFLWPLAVLSATALLLGAPCLLRNGDGKHAQAHDLRRRYAAVLRMSEGGSPGAIHQVRWMASLMRLWLWPLRTWLQRSSRQAVRGADDALARALWLVSPGVTAAQQAWSLVLMSGMLLAPWVALLLVSSPKAAAWPWESPAAWPIGALQGMFLLTLHSCGMEHWSSRKGQALLRLLPQQATGAALAAAWRKALVRHAFSGWLMCTGLALALTAWAQPPAWPLALLGGLISLPAVALLGRQDWARLPPPATHLSLAAITQRGGDPVVTSLGWAVLTATPLLLWPSIAAWPGAAYALMAVGLAFVALTAALLRPPRQPLQAPWPAGRWA